MKEKFVLGKHEIEIVKKEGDYAVIANIWADGIKILDGGKATICLFANKPEKLYLKFDYENEQYKEYAICICDRDMDHRSSRSREEVEKNRALCDFLYEKIFASDKSLPIFEFTTYHWENWEQE